MTPQRFRLHNVGSMLGTFGVANLQADPNCVLAQLPDYGVWGLQDFLPRRNLLSYTGFESSTYWTIASNPPTLTIGQPSIDAISDFAKIEKTTGTSDSYAFSNTITGLSKSPSDSLVYTLKFYLKKDGDATQFPEFFLYASGGTATGKAFQVNKVTGETIVRTTIGSPVTNDITVESYSDMFWFVTIRLADNGANTKLQIYFRPTAGTTWGAFSVSTTGSIIIGRPMLCRADTIDQSYQKITDWTTEQYAWAAQKQVPWLRRNRFLNTATLSTQTVSSVTAVPITVSFKGTGTITFSTAYSGSLVGTGVNDRVTATFTPSAGNLVCTVSGTVTEAQCENASAATPYQAIGASWDATYAALAAAAGFNTGIWQDAGTNPVNTSGQSVYRIADASGKGYTANQATAANRPLWTLDANAKAHLGGDQVNDAMPVTFPASFSSNASVYVTTDAGTTVTDAVTLNGSYAPLVAEKQYARVVFANGRPSYHNRLVKWLNAKAGL